MIKLIISLIKYSPQVYLNYRRKSTEGFVIYSIMLDFTGGIMSLTQLILDAVTQDDWSGIIGNPVNFAFHDLKNKK